MPTPPSVGVQQNPQVLGAGANAPMIQTHEPQAVVMYDLSNPRCLMNLLPVKVREKVQEALFEEGALFELDEQELYKRLKSPSVGTDGKTRDGTITATDNRLRLKFWMEYDYCQGVAAKEIDMTRVYAGICTYEYFHRRYLNSPRKVAWLLCPPSSYQFKANEALEFALEQLRDILDTPHTSGMGKIDTKLAELKLKIFQTLDIRIKGAPVQRIIQANLHGNDAANAVHQASRIMSIEQLEKELQNLAKREKELQNGGTVLITQAPKKA
jgi:hypothetical protein